MAKYKHYEYSQSVLIPVCLEEQLMPGTLEFAIHTLVETRIDTCIFEDRYHNDETGRWAYDPKILLKVVLFAYSRGILSSRKIERACLENVTFMALCCGQHPDHSTIAAFVSSMKDDIVVLFRDVLLVCDEMGLLGGTLFALDGSKFSSNASKEWSGTVSELNRKKEKIEKKVEGLLREQMETDKRDKDDEKGGGSSGLSNRKKQIERLKKKAERIEKFLQDNGPKIGSRGKEIKSNITDNESAKMKTSHGVIQGYNGQTLVDAKHQMIVHGQAFGNGQDHDLFSPMLEGAKENMRAIGHGEDYFVEKVLVADTNYHCENNLSKCDEERIDAYIPDGGFRKRDPRFATQQRYKPKRQRRFTLKDFRHNKGADEYICPGGKTLKVAEKKKVVGQIIYRQYSANKEDCEACVLRLKCLRGIKVKRRNLMVPLGPTPGNLSSAMAKKIDTEHSRRIYDQRAAIVEPVFANIRVQKRLDRFTLRGRGKVNIQWLLYCIVHNIEKIANYGFT